MKRVHILVFPFLLTAILVFAFTSTALSTSLPPQADAPGAARLAAATPTNTVEADLLLVGPSGQKAFSIADLKKLKASSGYAGMKSSTGKITLPATYKGVALSDLAALVGKPDGTLGVEATAKDGYAMTFSFDQLTKGDFVAYDPATGDEKKEKPKLTVILAYEMDGKAIPADGDGPLRLAIISTKPDQVTDGHWSEKWVKKIELKPLGKEWSLMTHGIIKDKIDRNSFQSCSAKLCHQGVWKDGQAQDWVGVPLWLLVGHMDDEIKHDGPAFNQTLADMGYQVQVVAADGYSVTLDIAQVKRNNNLVVAYQVNGNPLPDKYFPLRLVGPDLKKNEMVGQIAEIKMVVDPKVLAKLPTPAPTKTTSAKPAASVTPTAKASGAAPAAAALSITGLVEKPLSLKDADLKGMKVVKITAEHPKKGKQDYSGVRLSDLLTMAKVKPNAVTVVITADDGYSAEVEWAKVKACTDCLVAFTDTPGKYSMVMPGLSSQAWVKYPVSIEIK